MRKRRKNYTPQEKVAILRKHLIEGVTVADICEEHQLQPTLFYGWQKQFFENGAAAFERKRKNGSDPLKRQLASLKDKLQQKNEVIAELMQEHVQLKKELGEP